jgi:hypothetical protein
MRTEEFPLQRIGKNCSHGNEKMFIRQPQKWNIVPLYGMFHIWSAWSQLRSRELTRRRIQKRRDTGESYGVLETQNKREERRLGSDLLTEFVQGASKGGSVEVFGCYCSGNFWSVLSICRSAWWLSNNSIHRSREPIIYTYRVTMTRDSIFYNKFKKIATKLFMGIHLIYLYELCWISHA